MDESNGVGDDSLEAKPDMRVGTQARRSEADLVQVGIQSEDLSKQFNHEVQSSTCRTRFLTTV